MFCKGPAVSLFQESYFELMKKALRPGGIVCSQGSSVWIDLNHVKETIDACARQFPNVTYATALVPSYPCGSIGFVMGCLDVNRKLSEPVHHYSTDEVDSLGFRYYTTEVHKASFVLPRFASKAFKFWNMQNLSLHRQIICNFDKLWTYFKSIVYCECFCSRKIE